jgi:hypothetical protein
MIDDEGKSVVRWAKAKLKEVDHFLTEARRNPDLLDATKASKAAECVQQRNLRRRKRNLKK